MDAKKSPLDVLVSYQRLAGLVMGDPRSMAQIVGFYGQLVAGHDPCNRCGHGRFEHKKTGILDAEIRAHDDALTPTQCRRGHYCAQEPRVREGCSCPAWEGVETPLPEFP